MAVSGVLRMARESLFEIFRCLIAVVPIEYAEKGDLRIGDGNELGDVFIFHCGALSLSKGNMRRKKANVCRFARGVEIV